MSLRILFAFITLYVLASFGWLMYSLFQSNNQQFDDKLRILEAGQNACVLNVIVQANNDKLDGPITDTIYLKQLQLVVDRNQLQSYVSSTYKNQYITTFTKQEGKTYVAIEINPEQIVQEQNRKNNQRVLLLLQTILLFAFVGTGIYGIIYTVRNAYRLSNQQNNFLLSVTHELKTPIASVRLMMQTLLSRKLPEEKRTMLMNNAVNATIRLEELTENMLTATQIENDHYNYGFEEIDLNNMLTFIVNNFKVKGEVTAELIEKCVVMGDNFVLRIAFNNLIDNALKYSDSKPVHVTLSIDGKNALVKIKDQGIGIDPKQAKKIFKRFYRIQDEETRTTKGTGLGLFIVKEVVDKHKGKISIQQNEPHGTIFTISLPLVR